MGDDRAVPLEPGGHVPERVGDVVLLQDRRYDPASSRVEVEWTFLRAGEETRRRSSIRIYSYRELSGLLEAAGFMSCEGYDSTSERPFHLGARRLVLVATKRDAA